MSSNASGELPRGRVIAAWVLQVIAAAILAQTLFFKFSGAPESVYIFSKLGVEPWGRYFAGASELVAAVLLLIPRMSIFGAAMAMGIMLGAIGSHLGPLGIVVEKDGGLLFGLAIIVFGCAAGVLALRREQVRAAIKRPLQYVRTGA
ncbi:MAG TPA: DoxX family protein [Phycisphaerales bacterium]|nr:DoxX family protein [Phycisphaerales bacterium]